MCFASVIPGRERKLANPESRGSEHFGIPGSRLTACPGMTSES
jgi:hypothetical protein